MVSYCRECFYSSTRCELRCEFPRSVNSLHCQCCKEFLENNRCWNHSLCRGLSVIQSQQILSKATPIKQRLQNVMFAIFHVTEASILCDKLLRLTHFSHSYRSWATDFSLPVFFLRQTVVIDTFFAFQSFLVEEQKLPR